MKKATQQIIWEELTADEDLTSQLKIAANPFRFQTELKTIIDSFYRENSRVLEAGCSTGITSLILDDRFDKTLVDLNAAAIRLSQELFGQFKKKATFVVDDMFRLPFPDESFDVVFNSGVLEHFEYHDRVRALREYGRVMKQDGIMLIAFPNHFSKPYKLVYEYLNSRNRWPYPKELALYDLKNELIQSGFKLIERRIIDRRTPINYLNHVKGYGTALKMYYKVVGYEGYLTSVTARKKQRTMTANQDGAYTHLYNMSNSESASHNTNT
jgi:ubiquinone/menaquinone biosynthesis C-methylase UbiE